MALFLKEKQFILKPPCGQLPQSPSNEITAVFFSKEISEISLCWEGSSVKVRTGKKSSSCSRVGLGCMAQDVGFVMRGAGRSASPSALLVGFPSPYLVKDSKCAFDPLFRSLPCAELRMCCFGGTWAVGMWKMRRVIMTLREVVVVLALILRRCAGEFLLSVLFNTAFCWFLFSPETIVRGYQPMVLVVNLFPNLCSSTGKSSMCSPF